MQKIELLPEASAVIESTRSLGYSFHDAVADIIDNSVSAFADNIDLYYDYDCAEPFLSIFDNGCGMNDSELRQAMIYGSKNPLSDRDNSDLGRFGLGLKVASLSQCSKLTVISKKEGKISGYCWDMDVVREDNRWNVLVVDPATISGMQIEKIDACTTGTLVIWQNFDIIIKGTDSISDSLMKRLHKTRDHISLVFHRYLERSGPMSDARNITIRMNNAELKPRDPFLTKNSLTSRRVKQDLTYHNAKIHVEGFILPHLDKLTFEEIESLGGKGKLHKFQGFYVYRNKRLIMPGGSWLTLTSKTQLQNLARVMIDLPNNLDMEWSVDVKKASVHLPEDFKDQLKAVLYDVLTVSKKVYTYHGKKNMDAKDRIIVRCDYKDYVTYEINREHPMISELLANPEVGHDFSTVLSMIEHSIPYAEIRNDFEQKLKPNELTTEEQDEYLHMAIAYINMGGDINDLALKEPYSTYPDLIKILKSKGY